MSFNFSSRQDGKGNPRRSKKQSKPAEPQRKPVHVRSGRNVYEIGRASTDEEISSIFHDYCEALMVQENPWVISSTYPNVTKRHKHVSDVVDQPQCYYININTFALTHINRTGISFANWEEPTPPSTFKKIDAHIAAIRKKAPKKNFCEKNYDGDGWWFDIHVYVDGFSDPCEYLAAHASKALLHAKAVAAEPPWSAPPTVTDTSPARLWTAFLQQHSEEMEEDDHDAFDYVFVDCRLSQLALTLSIDYDMWRQFIHWVARGQSLSFKEAEARYAPHPESPEWDKDRMMVGYPLPFTLRNCPRPLRFHFMVPHGWVYIMGIEGSTHLKIGHCLTAMQKRRDQMQVGVPHHLTILGGYPTSRRNAPRLEHFTHRLLKDVRQGKTEWFAVDLPTAHKAILTAIQQEGDERYFWTYEQWAEHDEAEEERLGEYYEQYPWEDPENEEWLMRE